MFHYKPKLMSYILLLGIALFLSSSALIYDYDTGYTQVAPTASPDRQVIAVNGGVLSGAIALADVNGDGKSDIVVGGRDGKVHVYDGSGAALWDYDTGDMGISGKPAIGDIDGDGAMEVVVAAGDNLTLRTHGGVYVLDHQGQLQCSFNTSDTDGDGFRDGVYASPAIVDLTGDGNLEIVFGGWDFFVRAIRSDCTLLWEDFVRDTIWSSPAIGDIDNDGFPDIVIGVDTHNEPGYNTVRGGMLHVFNRQGARMPGFPIQIDEVIFSSPALGDIDNDGRLDIVVGTGDFWSNPNCNHPDGCAPGVGRYVNAWNHLGQPLPGWPRPTNAIVFASPTLADLNGDAVPEVIVNARDATVYAWYGNGNAVEGWPKVPVTPAGPGTTVSFHTDMSPIVADVNGDQTPEVILPSNWEVVVWDRAGTQITRSSFPPPADAWDLATDFSLSGNPAVGDIDGDGLYELTVGGALTGGTQGAVYVWHLNSTPQPNDWPSFRKDQRNRAVLETLPSVTSVTQNVLLLHPNDGSSTTARTLVKVSVSARAAEVQWSATAARPDIVEVVLMSAARNASQVTFAVTVNAENLPDGVNDVGNVEISGRVNGQLLNGSPITVPMSVYVGDISSIYLPSIKGN